jgi:hypothetical protein
VVFAAYRLGQRVFEPSPQALGGSQSRSVGFAEKKRAMYPLFVGRFKPVDGPKGSNDDPICALCDRRVSVGPVGLHKSI